MQSRAPDGNVMMRDDYSNRGGFFVCTGRDRAVGRLSTSSKYANGGKIICAPGEGILLLCVQNLLQSSTHNGSYASGREDFAAMCTIW